MAGFNCQNKSLGTFDILSTQPKHVKQQQSIKNWIKRTFKCSMTKRNWETDIC